MAHREDIDIQLYVARDLVMGHLGERQGREGGRVRGRVEKRGESWKRGRKGERKREQEGEEREREEKRKGGGTGKGGRWRGEDTATHFFEADHHFSGELHVFEHLQFAGEVGTTL